MCMLELVNREAGVEGFISVWLFSFACSEAEAMLISQAESRDPQPRAINQPILQPI